MNVDYMTPSLARAARAILAWSMDDLARITGMASTTIRDYENGTRKPRQLSLRAMADAYRDAGIEFIGGPDEIPGLRVHRKELLDNPPQLRPRKNARK